MNQALPSASSVDAVGGRHIRDVGEFFGLGIEARQCAGRPDMAGLGIDAGWCACAPSSWYSVIFCVFGSQRPSLFEPCWVSHTAAVGRGHRGMDGGGADIAAPGYSFDLAGRRIEPRDLVGAPVIRNPEAAVLVGMRAPGHAVGARQLVFHVDDLHRLVAERPHRVLVVAAARPATSAAPSPRRTRGSCRRSTSSAFWSLKPKRGSHDEEAHGVAHVVHAVAPAVLVARDRRHARLEAVAGHAVDEEQVLAARLRQEAACPATWRCRSSAPCPSAGRSRGGVLIGGEVQAAAADRR